MAITAFERHLLILNALPPERCYMPRFELIDRRVIIRRSVATMTFDCQVQSLNAEEVFSAYELRTYLEMLEILKDLENANEWAA